MAAVAILNDFEAQEIKYVTVSAFPLLFALKWWAPCHDLSFLNAELQASFLALILLSTARAVSSSYQRFLTSLPANVCRATH